MVEQKSLRSTREVVLAFRAAAHLNEDKGKAYKFTITNSDGKIRHPISRVLLTCSSLQQAVGHRAEAYPGCSPTSSACKGAGIRQDVRTTMSGFT